MTLYNNSITSLIIFRIVTIIAAILDFSQHKRLSSETILVSDIILGIIRNLKWLKRKLKHGSNLIDFRHSRTEHIQGKYEIFEFKSYYPYAFEAIRSNICNLKVKKFMKSWKAEHQLCLTESTGKSGSLFFNTSDGKYFFKTISRSEKKAVKFILKDYYYDRHSFIMRILGLYRIKYHKMDWTYILVFKNSLPYDVKMHVTCDLKGRKPKPGKRNEIEFEGYPLKDNQISRGLNFKRKRDVRFFRSQIIKDSEFLKKQNLMDYSLLIGVHKLSYDTTRIYRYLSKRGGFIGTDPYTHQTEFYFFGIIDCLTRYGFRKKLANFIKRFLWRVDTLSTVESKYYAQRFQQFMTETLLSNEKIKVHAVQ